MLSSVAQIGNYIIENNDEKDLNNPLSILVENPNTDGKHNIVFKIAFDENLNYLGVFDDRFDSFMIPKLLYSETKGSKPNPSPTVKLTTGARSFKQIMNAIKSSNDFKRVELFSKLYDALSKNKDNIINHLEKLKKEYPKEGIILTITIKDNDNEKYIGDF